MSVRSVVVRLEAEVSKFLRGQQQAKQATDETAKAQEALSKAVDGAAAKQAAGADKVASSNKKASQSSEESANSSKRSSQASEEDAKAKAKQADAAEKVGRSLTVFGATTVAALGATAKAAMDWESAWAGVTKTVDGTPAQMKEIESGLRNLAKTLPSTHEEIAAVAESAGALGVKRQDIIQFTKTMVDLGETTNLSADEAATAIAQLLNVMGDAGGEVDNLGSTLVALGNDGASTEKEIITMAQRISGAGKLVGASKADVLALASTLASLGVQAELGGGVTSRVMQRMYTDVKTGGEGLQKLAQVAGVSSSQFAKAFETSPVRAMDMVFQGLNKVKESGGNVVQTMEDLGIKGTEETGVVLRLAGAGDILSHSLDVGSKAWTENTALAAEASKRYETTESKVKVAWNNIKDAAIDAGAVLLPIMQTMAESVAGLAQGWSSLPKPVQNTVTVMAGVVGVAALVAGGLLTVIPKIKETYEAFQTLNTRTDGSSRGLDKWGKAAGVATAAIVGMAVVGSISDSLLPSTETAEQLAQRLVNVSNGVKSADEAFDKSAFTRANAFIGTTNEINNIGDAINRVVNPGTEGFRDWVNETFPIASSQIKETKDTIKGVDQQLATLYTSGNTEGAAKSFKAIAESAAKHNVKLEDVIKLYPNYRDAVLAAGRQADGTAMSTEELNKRMQEAPAASAQAAASQDVLKKALEETGVNIDSAIEGMEKFLELLFATGLATMSARDANAAYNDAIRGVDEAMKTIADSGGKMGRVLNDNKTDFDLTTEAGSLANSTFQKIARGGMTEVEAMSKEGLGQDALQGKLNKTYDDLVLAGQGMGLTRDAAVELTRKVLGVPPGVSITSWMSEQAKITADNTKKSMDAIDGRVVRTYTTHEEKTIRILETQVRGGGYADDPSMTALRPGSLAPGKAKGGRVPGLAGGGRIDYPQPTDITKDNVMGLINGEPKVALQGREWVINGRSSDEYDDELAAINAGTFPKGGELQAINSGSFPKYFGGTTSSTSVMSAAPAGLASVSGPMSFTGQLVLDSGEFLGTVRGVATQEISGALNNAARTAGGRR